MDKNTHTLVTPEELKDSALQFLKKEKNMVLGTSVNNHVWSATVHMVVTDELELIFFSRPDTRHCQNILKNPNVSAVITGGTRGSEKSIQLAEVARVADGVEWNTYFEIYSKVVKNAAKRVDQVIYVIKPTEIWIIDEKLLGTRTRTQVL